MNSYAVSIVWTKREENNSTHIYNTLRILNADNANEAFGLAYDATEERKTHSLLTKLIVEIKNESND